MTLTIGHVRYINIQAWLRGFRVKIANFLSFFCLSIPKRDLETKKTTPNIEVWPESLGAMLEYWYIERGLLLHCANAPPSVVEKLPKSCIRGCLKVWRRATTQKDKSFEPKKWFLTLPLIKRFVNLRSVTQSCAKAFQCLPSSNKKIKLKKTTKNTITLTEEQQELLQPYMCSSISNTSTNLRDRKKNPVQYFVRPSFGWKCLQLPCDAVKTINYSAKPWRYSCSQTYPLFCVGSPFTIKHVEHILMYGLIVKINGSTQN